MVDLTRLGGKMSPYNYPFMRLTSYFWNLASLEYNISSQTNGQIGRVNRVLEDMLRMYVMCQPKRLGECLPLVELSYENGYRVIEDEPF